ncbi:adenylate kinase family protein [Candidatus Hydrogenosomobacter endosymbioticus]|uniref:Adenylate kinase n=1 Tax=Candidatus Hydrogenosomobacter endosymbioticus TaxID=2558174 RepID=A0ABN6L2K3_9PROT|nr:nucleoside monophosphate kinase [Candidatus Hydrogenosomobacter endosymbioticus]BDB96003.1 adenylate kinase [Candidatus Hydrogenosomobacter endosymbioticus]
MISDVIVVLGPPGSGKGTQARALSCSLDVPSIGMGDLLRQEIADGTEIGRLIQAEVESGGAPDTALVMDVLNSRLRKISAGTVILEGFPRDLAQAEAFESVLKDLRAKILMVFLLVVPEEELVDRALRRYSCSGCSAIYSVGKRDTAVDGVCDVCRCTKFTRRSDDQSHIIRKRLMLDKKKASGLISFYEGSGMLMSMDGCAPVEEISRVMSRVIESKLSLL